MLATEQGPWNITNVQNNVDNSLYKSGYDYLDDFYMLTHITCHVFNCNEETVI